MTKKYKNTNSDVLVVKGARTHNLQDITVEMPRNKMVVFTGLSGSGKSSLAFDTIFAEGQRRYVESLSAYARQFLHQMQKPDVDEIIGLSPAISIDQKSRSNNPRSTVATITEIYDYLRVLFARVGKPHCLVCGEEIKRLSLEEIKNFCLEKISANKNRKYLEVISPVVRGRKGEYYQLLYDLLGKGYSEVLIDGARKKLRERIALSKNSKHNIEAIVDKIEIKQFDFNHKDSEERLSESIERALQESDGLVKIVFDADFKGELVLSSKFACPRDGYSYPEIEPRLFSFNSPYGACPECNGLGTKFLFSNETCEACGGARLRKEALSVLVGGKNIVNITSFSIEDAKSFFEGLKLSTVDKEISKVVLREIEDRLQFMIDVGIQYLTLSRTANTLS
ncbi:MAG: ABC-ATPase UvrA, partial [Patescibacteria group bacterium]